MSTYYLDTTIQLGKLFAPQTVRSSINERMKSHQCVVSRYVRMEYMRWLEPCVHLDKLLREEAERNPVIAISEVQARVLLQFGREQNKMLSILTWLHRHHNDQNVYSVISSLSNLITNNLDLFFYESVEELPDPIACPLMDLQAISDGTGYQLDPDLPYRRGEMPCNIVDFLCQHSDKLQELAGVLSQDYPRIAETCQRVLARPADAQGNNCKTLGDIIIALQTPDDAILWTTDASFELICPTLGIEYLREPLQN